MRKNKKGFTLVELVIVIAVIAILAAVLIPTFTGILQRARESVRMQTAVTTRDELLGQPDIYTITDLENYLVKVDGVYYMITARGTVEMVGTDIEEIADEYELEYTESDSIALNSNVVAYIPKSTALKESGIYYHDKLVMTWDELKASGYLHYGYETSGYMTSSSLSSTDSETKYFYGIWTKDNSNYYSSYKRIDVDYDEIVIDSSMVGMSSDIFYSSYEKDNLKSISIPKTISKIYVSNSSTANVIENIVVERGNNYYYSDGLGLYSTDTLITYAKGAEDISYDVKDQVRIMGEYYTITGIADYVFTNCEYLSGVTIPDSVIDLTVNSFDESYRTVDGNITYLRNGTNDYYYVVAVKNNVNEINNISSESRVIVGSVFSSFGTQYYLTNVASSTSENTNYYNYYTTLDTLNIGSNIKVISGFAFKTVKVRQFNIATDNENFSVIENGTILLNGTTLVTYSIDAAYRETLDLTETNITEIAPCAFTLNNQIGEIKLPSTLAKIGDYAFISFGRFASGKKITFADETQGIKVGQYALAGMKDSSIISSYAYFTYLDTNAFYYSEMPEEINLIKVENIASSAFYYVNNLTNIKIGKYLSVISNTFLRYQNIDVEISSENLDFVSDNGNAILQNNRLIIVTHFDDNVTEYTIPSSARTIEPYAFSNTNNSYYVKKITMPGNLAKIEDKGLYGLSSGVNELNLNEGLGFIGNNIISTDYYSGTMELFTIPSTVTTIRTKAFENMRNINQIAVAQGNTLYATNAGGTLLYEVEGKLLYVVRTYTAFTTEGTTIREIGENGMNTLSNNLVSLNLTGVVKLGASSIYYTTDALTTLNIPASLTDIDQKAFSNMSYVSTVNVDSNNTVYKGTNDQNAIVEKTTNRLVYIAIKTSVLHASDVGLTEIPDNYFSNFTALTDVDLTGVETIGAKAFGTNSNITSLTLPASLREIDASTISNLPNITSISIDANNENFVVVDNKILYTNDYSKLIVGLKNVSSLSIPNATTEIGAYAFEKNKNLTSLNLNNVTVIGKNAFNECSNIISSIDASRVTNVGDWAFRGTKISGNLNLSSITEIGSLAFNATRITGVTFNNNLETIGSSAFSNCKQLTGTLTIPSSVTTIGSEAFYYCENITRIEGINASSHLTSISYQLFRGCKNMTGDIVIPDCCTSIEQSAFSECSKLNSVTFSSSLEVIKNAFNQCQITSYDLSMTHITKLDAWFFGVDAGSRNIDSPVRTVRLPGTIVEFDYCVFWRCQSLTDVYFGGTMAQWRAIIKGTNWKNGARSFTVHCTDGNLTE